MCIYRYAALMSWSGLSSCGLQPLLKLPNTLTAQITGSNFREERRCKERSYSAFLLLAFLPETFRSPSAAPFLRHYTCSDFWGKKKTNEQKNSSLSILLYLPGYLLGHTIINRSGRELVLAMWRSELPSITEGRKAECEPHVVREGRFILVALAAV